MSARRGKEFGSYTLVDRIARGGMAEIFLARTRGFRGFEKTLVIKRLHEHYSDDEQFIRMLVDEAKITVQLQHANIVQVFDLGQVDGHFYIAMEYIDGLDLFQVLRELHERQLHMPVEAAAFIASELCHGLHHAHTRRDPLTREPLHVIHRDISPQNILLSWAGEVKIADFGIVKAAHRSTFTQAGVIKGKFYYMSPEQALGADLDYRSDIFSAGIVLYEALTATPLYDDPDDSQLLKRVQAADIAPPSELRPDIPPELETICLRALSRDRGHRPQSALELARSLSNFLVHRGRSFTKVDLGDFLSSLFAEDERGATNPELPAGEIERLSIPAASEHPGDIGPTRNALPPPGRPRAPLVIEEMEEIEDPGATMALPLRRDQPKAPIPDPTAPIPPAPAAAKPAPEPTAPLPPAPRQPPPPAKAPEPERSPSAPPRTPSAPPEPAPRRGVQVPASTATPSLARPPSGKHEARTERLSLAEIAAADAEIRARLQSATAAPSTTAGPQPAVHSPRRERGLRIALGLVAVAILAVSATIVWLLLNPVTAPAPPPPPASEWPEARPRATEPRPAPTLAETTPAADAATRARLKVEGPATGQRYRLYVNGELAEVEDGEVTVRPGRVTVRARLLPEGTFTDEQVLDVPPGRTVPIQL